MSEDKDRLYALMTAAEDTQKAAAAAVEALRVELAALAQQVEVQRALTVGQGEALHRLDGAVATLEGAGPRVATAAATTVRDTVARTMQAEAAGRDEAAATATHGAITKAVGEQAAVLQAVATQTVATAREVEGRFQRAAAGLGWRWMAVVAAGMVAAVVATVGVGYGVGWWQGERIETQRATIERLTPEVERLEALEARGEELEPAARFLRGLPEGMYGTCGEGQCVMVDERRRASSPEDAPEHSAVFMVWGSDDEFDG